MSDWIIGDARTVLRRAWSVRLAMLAAVFSAMEIVLPYLDGFVPRRVLAGLALVTAIGSVAARFIHQPGMHPQEDERRDA